MTHEQWMDVLKKQHDYCGYGFSDAHWHWITNKNTYMKIIQLVDINYFYHLAVRNTNYDT